MSETTLKARLVHPCKTDAEWASSNPVAKKGEIMISSDKSGMFKVGNGTSKWSELGYNHVTWANVEGKPSTYPATAHTHDDRYYTESEINDKVTALNNSIATKVTEKTITTATDFNTFTTTGIYHICVSTNSNLHAPTTNHGTLIVDFSVGTPYQIWIPDNNMIAQYKRTYSSSTWSGWTTQKLTDTVYTHPSYTAYASGLYKITTNSLGHVTSATAVTKGDITALGIPGSNTDSKVLQTAVKSSDYTNWRTVLWGASNSGTEGFTPTTVTDSVFSSQTLTFQPSTGTLKANTFKGNLSGNATSATSATTATKLATARTISLTGSVTGSGSFDGSGNLSIATSTNHTHTKAQIGLGNVDNTADKDKSVKYASSAGNADTLDNYHADNFHYTHQSSWDFTIGMSRRYVTFDASNPKGGPASVPWVNGFVSTHNDYLSSYIVNSHRSSDWYVGYAEHTNSTNINPTWYKLLHSGNYTSYCATSGHNHDSVYSKLGHTHTKSQITDFPTLGTAASKNTRTLTSVSHSSWTNVSTDQGYVPDMAFIAYWNGAYSSNGASSLAYCNRGAFGTIVTKNAGDYASAGHTHSYAGSSSVGGSANSAVKLATARNIKVGGLSNFSFNFDGSGNISVDNWGYGTNKYVTTDSVSAPYFRIAYTETKNSYTDASMILMIDGGNAGGGFGILKVAFRSDNISTVRHSHVELLWLVRKGFSEDQFFVKGYNPANETQYADLYFKANGTYCGVVVTALSMGGRGSKSRSWTFDSGDPRSAADIRKYSYIITSSDAGITKTCTGNASTATKLVTARSINGTNFDGSGNITTANWGTARTITIGNTGKSVNGGGNVSWSLSEIGAAASSHSHNYAGSSSAGGSATSAVKLDTATAGSATQPVYFSGGKPVACTYTLGKSVPSNAVFTDTNTWRGIQNNLTSDSTSDSLSAAQGKVLKGLVDGKANTSHTHTKSQITDFPSSMPASDVYSWAKSSTKPSYSWSEIGSKPSTFTPSSHTHNYLPLSGGTVTNNTAFNKDLYVYGETYLNGNNVYINGKTNIQGNGLEIFHSTPYIDFHFNNDSGDQTSRIIELEKGKLNVNGTVCTNDGSLWCTSFTTDGSGTFGGGVNATRESTFCSGSYTDPLPGVICGIKVSGMATATRFYVRGRSGTWLSSAQPGGAGFECVNDTIDSALIPGWRIRNLSGAWVGASYNMDKAFHLYYAKAERLSGNTDNGTDADFIFNGRTGNFSAKSITQTSDERRKSVISSSILDTYKDFFMKIKPFSFKWKDGQDDTATHLGVGAQSVFHTALECGFEENDIGLVQRGKEYPGTSIPWSVSYTEFIPLNIAVTQDHETRIEKLERENEELKQQIKELKGLTA